MTKPLIFDLFKIYPMLLNFILLLIISVPSKKNKFNPINFLLLLIIFTLILVLKMNFLLSSWNSYILFLIMIGGLLIIFMYITSLSNNDMSYMNLKLIFMNFLKCAPLIILVLFLPQMISYFELNNYYIWKMNFKLLNINFIEMFMMYYNYNNLFIMNYLFYSLICIMNICYKFKLPLRQMFF